MTLEQICNETIAATAAAVDRNGAFPEESIAALRSSGFLGAMSAAEVGGSGLGLAGAAAVETHAAETVRRAAASGEHLSTLVFSEAGSRSHFWAPAGTARSDGDSVILAALREGWQRVTQLTREMGEGRKKRLERPGFGEREAVELSSLHTRNLM